MKINQIIKESDGYSEEELFEKIINSQFFKTNKQSIFTNRPLYRGLPDSTKTDVIHDFKYRTHTRDTPYDIHRKANEFSKDIHGIPVRNLMFAIKNFIQAKIYGSVFVVFPIGEYDLYYHPRITDFSIELVQGSPLAHFAERKEKETQHVWSNMQPVFEMARESLSEKDKEAYDKVVVFEYEQFSMFDLLFRRRLDDIGSKNKKLEDIDITHVVSEMMERISDHPTDDVGELEKQILFTINKSVPYYIDLIYEVVKTYIKNIEKTKDLKDTGDDSNEIMVHCEQYVVLSNEQFGRFLDKYKGQI